MANDSVVKQLFHYSVPEIFFSFSILQIHDDPTKMSSVHLKLWNLPYQLKQIVNRNYDKMEPELKWWNWTIIEMYTFCTKDRYKKSLLQWKQCLPFVQADHLLIDWSRWEHWIILILKSPNIQTYLMQILFIPLVVHPLHSRAIIHYKFQYMWTWGSSISRYKSD